MSIPLSPPPAPVTPSVAVVAPPPPPPDFPQRYRTRAYYCAHCAVYYVDQCPVHIKPMQTADRASLLEVDPALRVPRDHLPVPRSPRSLELLAAAHDQTALEEPRAVLYALLQWARHSDWGVAPADFEEWLRDGRGRVALQRQGHTAALAFDDTTSDDIETLAPSVAPSAGDGLPAAAVADPDPIASVRRRPPPPPSPA